MIERTNENDQQGRGIDSTQVSPTDRDFWCIVLFSCLSLLFLDSKVEGNNRILSVPFQRFLSLRGSSPAATMPHPLPGWLAQPEATVLQLTPTPHTAFCSPVGLSDRKHSFVSYEKPLHLPHKAAGVVKRGWWSFAS